MSGFASVRDLGGYAPEITKVVDKGTIPAPISTLHCTQPDCWTWWHLRTANWLHLGVDMALAMALATEVMSGAAFCVLQTELMSAAKPCD